jgi:hypothetical protein
VRQLVARRDLRAGDLDGTSWDVEAMECRGPEKRLWGRGF